MSYSPWAVVVALCMLVGPLRSGELQDPHKSEIFLRDVSHQPLMRYQAGHVFSMNQYKNSIWVESVQAHGKQSLETAITLPNSFQVLVRDVAVSFDREIAVSGFATDKEGRFVNFLAWLRPDGSLIRVVRTSEFAAGKMGFTADGSLWVVGVVKINKDEAHPTHEILRHYNSEGILVGSALPRSDFSYDHWHPALNSYLVTSRNYVAFVSESAKTWTLVSTVGVVINHGRIDVPNDFSISSVAVTDSGRLFMTGRWLGKQMFPLFEVGDSKGPQSVDITNLVPSQEFGHLLGSDDEDLVFHFSFSDQSSIVWSRVD